MSITPTGHAEIDQQHEILNNLVAQLETFCPESHDARTPTCSACGEGRMLACRSTLVEMVRELGAFLGGHATYEERMMELLPDTPTCQAHIKAHQAAHQGVARQLKKLSAMAESDTPLDTSQEVWRIIGDWLGDHAALFDNRLVRMTRAASPEIDFDNELVGMLDKYVFVNRPTVAKQKTPSSAILHKAKTEVRIRFESLTPAQKSVFWLVVGGRKNREIAEELAITLNTVKTHRAAIFQKMGVVSVVELIKKTDVLR